MTENDQPVGVEDHDDEDVQAALERKTDDGPGFETDSQLPQEDFESFAEDDVEVVEEDQ